MPAADPLASIRHQIALNARHKHRRRLGWDLGFPCEWRPHEVWLPTAGCFMTDPGAWEVIADLATSGHQLKPVVLRIPPDRDAYEMLWRPAPGEPIVYIKVHLGSGCVIGRSFHYSKYQPTVTSPRGGGDL